MGTTTDYHNEKYFVLTTICKIIPHYATDLSILTDTCKSLLNVKAKILEYVTVHNRRLSATVTLFNKIHAI